LSPDGSEVSFTFCELTSKEVGRITNWVGHTHSVYDDEEKNSTSVSILTLAFQPIISHLSELQDDITEG
jgi:hypothetical protein